MPDKNIALLNDTLSFIFHLYEGVEIREVRLSDKNVCLALRIRDPKSLALFMYFREGANICSTVYTEGRPTETESAAESLGRLVWSFSFPRDDEDEVFPSTDLKIFCCYMIWDLGKRGILSKSESKKYCAVFGCAEK